MSTLYVDNLQPNLGSRVMAAGHVVQVVNSSLTTGLTTTSPTFIDTGLSAVITPTSASSKILVFVSLMSIENSATVSGTSVKLLRGSTDLSEWGRYMSYNYTYGTNHPSINYLDSPSTTGATTYKVQIKRSTGSGNVNLNSNNATSTMTLMEIAQ